MGYKPWGRRESDTGEATEHSVVKYPRGRQVESRPAFQLAALLKKHGLSCLYEFANFTIFRAVIPFSYLIVSEMLAARPKLAVSSFVTTQ